MLLKTDSALQYTNEFLNRRYSGVSPDNGAGTIAQALTGGGFSSGAITFAPNTDSNGGAYELYITSAVTASSLLVWQRYIQQTATQGTLGGRLVTFVDAPVDVFGPTVQVAINLMDDNTLLVTRSTAANTGVVLRGVDQGGDAQMTTLGVSSAALTGNGVLEIKVVFHGSAGTVEGWWTEDAVATVKVLNLTGKNTAVSGANQATEVLEGGYAANGIADDVLHHEDLAAKLSLLMIINSDAVVGDPFAPVDRIGAFMPLLSLPTADADTSEWTPDPGPDHFSNVNEVPPDNDTTENTAPSTLLRDDCTMQTVVATGTDAVHLAYTGFLHTDTPAECTGTGTPANFESLVFMEQTAPGTVEATFNDNGACFFTDLLTRRAQSVCTIAQDGESVTWKLNVQFNGFHDMFVGLSPLDNPPVVQVPSGGGGAYGPAVFNHLTDWVAAAPNQVVFTNPWPASWAIGSGYAADTQSHIASSSDFFEFKVFRIGTKQDVGLIDNATATTTFNPYNSPLIAIHFREDTVGSPYFWIGPSFAYNGETTYSYSETDNFRLTRNGTDIDITQNGFAVETFTPGVMPTILSPYMYAGRWGWDTITGYTLQPGIKDAFVQIAGSSCVGSYFSYLCTVPGSVPTTLHACDCNQWAVEFDYFGTGPTIIDATIFDPNAAASPNTPVFGCNLDTVFTFSLVGGNVVLTVDGWVTYADNMTTSVGDVATWVYTRPYADTDDFVLQSPYDGYPIQFPAYPGNSFPYAFIDQTANQPLRLVTLVEQNYDPDTPITGMGLTEVAFTFVDTDHPHQYAGYLHDTGDKDGNAVEVPASYAYAQSFLSTDSADAAITVDTFNANPDGYTDPE